MSMTDPIADMLTRIRNGIQAQHSDVEMPASNIKRAILERMQEEGYVGEVSFREDGLQGMLNVRLRYDKNGDSVIDELRRLSTPGRRVYVGASDIPKAQSGYGVVILSTSRGVLTDKKARELGVGGEVLCSVW